MRLRKKGIDRALLLSSTGTGKTLASAFALREMQPKRALFLVHREQIAKQSKSATTSSTGGLPLALQRASVTARP